MKFFTASQIHLLDKYTIENEPIASIDLMERAADALYWQYVGRFSYSVPVLIFAGQGNNGGDALALARILLITGLKVHVVLIHIGSLSSDCETMRQSLISKYPESLTELKNNFISPTLSEDTIIIDGLFGSGLNRPLSGLYADAVQWINQSGCKVVSIDIPSGLSGEDNSPTSIIVKADVTLSLQFPKLSFLMAENAPFVGNWEVLDIGIHPKAIENTSSNLFYMEGKEIANLLKTRQEFSHKGNFGHALIIAGSKGMAGASVLSSNAALRSGTGLVTVHGPASNRIIVQTSNPEVIFHSDLNEDFISETGAFELFSAIAVGPGIGTNDETGKMIGKFIKKLNKPCVFDADALNIISMNKELLYDIPKNSLLTPHPKEFDRLFGVSSSSYERMMKAYNASKEYGVIIILKGAHTLIATPDGNLYFNSTGNSGMATAGSGDVLTGILVGLLAQGYSALESAKIGVFIHGRSGDLALKKESKESLIGSDIISYLGKAYLSLRKEYSNLNSYR